jgi:hypothetical protein
MVGLDVQKLYGKDVVGMFNLFLAKEEGRRIALFDKPSNGLLSLRQQVERDFTQDTKNVQVGKLLVIVAAHSRSVEEESYEAIAIQRLQIVYEFV